MPLTTEGASSRPKRFYGVAEVAALLGVSEPMLYKAIRAGEFPAIKVRGRYVIPSRAIDAMEDAAMSFGLVEPAQFMPEGGDQR